MGHPRPTSRLAQGTLLGFSRSLPAPPGEPSSPSTGRGFRVRFVSDDLTVGARQVREWAPSLPQRGVLVVDSKYSEGAFLDHLAPLEHPLLPNAKDWTVADPADCPVDVLARMKGNRTLYFRPPAYPGQRAAAGAWGSLPFPRREHWAPGGSRGAGGRSPLGRSPPPRLAGSA